MAPRLKVFVTSDGLTEYFIATSSRPKALAAWGVRQDLFKEGRAEETDDPALTGPALEKPGEVLTRPAGGKAPVLPPAPARPQPRRALKPPPPRRPAAPPPPPPPPKPTPAQLQRVAELERRLAGLEAEFEREVADIADERARLDKREARVKADLERDKAKLEADLGKARAALGRG